MLQFLGFGLERDRDADGNVDGDAHGDRDAD